MKALKSIFAVSLFIVGLSLTSCSSDDKYIDPDAPSVDQPIYNPEADQPIWNPEATTPLP